MLAVAEDIFSDVDFEAMLLNGEVIRRAFNQILDEPKLNECCCQYWINPTEFSRLLDDYVKAKRIAKSANRRMFDPLTWKEKQDNPVWRLRQNRFVYTEECLNHRNELRAKLRAVWPCSKCMDKYNPTRRRRPWLM